MKIVNRKCLLLIVVAFLSVSMFSFTTLAAEPNTNSEKEGQKISLKMCQTCHNYQGTEQAGTIGPPLVGMKSRFPDRKKLFSIIHDPQKELNEHTMMPPFGRNNLLSKDEINKVIDFLYTL